MGIFGKSAPIQIKGKQVHGSRGSTITATGEPLVGTAVGAYAQVLAPQPTEYHNHYNDPYHDSKSAEGPHGQLGMFNVTPGRENPEISHLYATKGYEHLVPAVLSQAWATSKGRWGKAPEASADLSGHSTKVVNTAVRLGLIQPPKGNESVSQTNSSDFNSSEEMVHNAHNYTRSGEAFDLGEASEKLRQQVKSARSGRNLSQSQFSGGVGPKSEMVELPFK